MNKQHCEARADAGIGLVKRQVAHAETDEAAYEKEAKTVATEPRASSMGP